MADDTIHEWSPTQPRLSNQTPFDLASLHLSAPYQNQTASSVNTTALSKPEKNLLKASTKQQTTVMHKHTLHYINTVLNAVF